MFANGWRKLLLKCPASASRASLQLPSVFRLFVDWNFLRSLNLSWSTLCLLFLLIKTLFFFSLFVTFRGVVIGRRGKWGRAGEWWAIREIVSFPLFFFSLAECEWRVEALKCWRRHKSFNGYNNREKGEALAITQKSVSTIDDDINAEREWGERERELELAAASGVIISREPRSPAERLLWQEKLEKGRESESSSSGSSLRPEVEPEGTGWDRKYRTAPDSCAKTDALSLSFSGTSSYIYKYICTYLFISSVSISYNFPYIFYQFLLPPPPSDAVQPRWLDSPMLCNWFLPICFPLYNHDRCFFFFGFKSGRSCWNGPRLYRSSCQLISTEIAAPWDPFSSTTSPSRTPPPSFPL